MLIELLFLVGAGILFSVMGLRIWKFNDIKLIHDYHYKNVSKENQKAYTEQIGKGVLCMGTGMLLTAVLDFFTNTSYGWWGFFIGFAAGIVIIMRAQRKYNNGIGLF